MQTMNHDHLLHHQHKPAQAARKAWDERHAQRMKLCADNTDTFEHLDDGTLIACGTRLNGEQARYYLAVFVGQSCKLLKRCCGYYLDDCKRAASIERVRQSRAAKATFKAERAAERRQPHSLQVGDVLYASWGYDQTNIDFYEIIGVRGAVVDMRELKQHKTETGWAQGTAVPVRGQYAGELMRSKRPNHCNRIRLTSYSSAGPWDGRALHWTAYA